MKLFDSFLITLGMYTIIPVPQRAWTERGMRWTMVWLPFAGIIISGGWLLLLWLVWQGLVGNFIAAALLTLWPVMITGGLHIDGLADAADAIGSRRDRETRLRIMKEPTSGPSAILWTVSVLLIQLMAWLEILNIWPANNFRVRPGTTFRSIILLLLIPVLSRIMAGLGVSLLPPARANGLVKTFRDGLAPAVLPALVVMTVIAAIGCLLLDTMIGFILLAAAALCFISWLIMCRRGFGGVTGDLAGFLIVISETVLLTVFSVVLYLLNALGVTI